MTAPIAPRYRLGKVLGHGGQGRTYRAVDRETGQAVAVKLFRLSSALGWKRFDLFERECAVLQTLDHPGIPRYLDVFAVEEEGEFGLVMELVEGTSLGERLEGMGRRLSEPQLWNILHQALDILDYLHGRQPPVIHRDVKPDNLIQRPDGRLAVVDFGGVRVALRPEGGSTVVGTFGYMAPEQLYGEAKPAADIFGLGATIAALAAGVSADKLPRGGLKVDLSEVMSPSPLRRLLVQMLEPDPQQRLESVAAVRRAAGAEESSSAPSASPPKQKASRGGPGEPAGEVHEQPGGNRRGEAWEGRTPSQRRGTSAGRFFRLLGIEDLDRRAAGRGSEADQPAEASFAETAAEERFFPFVWRIIAALGQIGLLFVETVFLPVLFFVARRFSEPKRRARLEQREGRARGALKRGRRTMRMIAEKRRHTRRLPPHAPEAPTRSLPRRGRRGR